MTQKKQKFFRGKVLAMLQHPEAIAPAFDNIPYFSKEYVEKAIYSPGIQVKDGALFVEDYSSPDGKISCKEGQRRTIGALEGAERTIYVLGSSFAYSVICTDDQTIASHIQKLCNKGAAKGTIARYKVKNYGFRGARLQSYTLQLLALPIQKDDVVIVISHLKPYTTQRLDAWKHIKTQQMICNRLGAKYCFFYFPRLAELVNPSKYESARQSNRFDDVCYNPDKLNYDFTPQKKYHTPRIVQQLVVSGCPAFDLQHCVNRPHDHGEIYVDAAHLSPKGYMLLAQAIYEFFISKLEDDQVDAEDYTRRAYEYLASVIRQNYEKNENIASWLAGVKSAGFAADGIVGAIIMNCNPFTLGHRYVIETALNDVDFLYIFVVEEDLSDFSFKDRLELVKKGTAHLQERVKVFPAGEFIISSLTFPEYFEKTLLKESKVDTSNDVLIFASIIAPALNITKRFVGEEHACNVTRQYNESMKQLLPYLGIEVVEIPRLRSADVPISASTVRAYLALNDFQKIQVLVPDTTYEYLLVCRRNP